MSKKLTNTEINQISKLSCLKIEKSEVQQFQEDINDFLKMVDIIQSINTDNINPITHPFHISNRLRSDTITEKDNGDSIKQLTKFYENNHFQVPKVIG